MLYVELVLVGIGMVLVVLKLAVVSVSEPKLLLYVELVMLGIAMVLVVLMMVALI